MYISPFVAQMQSAATTAAVEEENTAAVLEGRPKKKRCRAKDRTSPLTSDLAVPTVLPITASATAPSVSVQASEALTRPVHAFTPATLQLFEEYEDVWMASAAMRTYVYRLREEARLKGMASSSL